MTEIQSLDFPLGVVTILLFFLVVGLVVYSIFRKSVKKQSLIKFTPTIDKDVNVKYVFAGKNGTPYNAKLIEGDKEWRTETYKNEGTLIMRDEQGEFKLSPVDLEQDIYVPRNWGIAFGSNYTVFCRIDRNNRICDWDNDMVSVKIRELSDITQKRIEEEVKEKLAQQYEEKNLLSGITTITQSKNIEEAIKKLGGG